MGLWVGYKSYQIQVREMINSFQNYKLHTLLFIVVKIYKMKFWKVSEKWSEIRAQELKRVWSSHWERERGRECVYQRKVT